MISSHIASILAPFAQLANKHALSDVYKCIEILPEKPCVRGCSAYGILEATVVIGIDQHVFLDVQTLYSVIKSLPDKEEVKFEIKGGTLHWECGLADGKLALMRQLDMPTIPEIDADVQVWNPTNTFLDALELGGVSCGSQGMKSAGIYGIALDNRPGGFAIYSSDNVTVSNCAIGDNVAIFPAMTVLSPDAAEMLATVIAGNVHVVGKDVPDRCSELIIEEKAIYCINKAFCLMLRPIAALKQDLRELCDNFAVAESVADLPRERLADFIKRAAALAESKQRAFVTLTAAEGALLLSFSEGVSATDEYHIVEGLNIPSLPEIKLDAGRVARVLSHVDQIVLDHIERGVLILRGSSPSFRYMISGRKDGSA